MTRPALTAVWDVPTRIFHWLLAALFAFSWWSAKSGHLDWHYKSGLTIVALLAFRILWGLWGSSTARFSNFIRGPKGIAAYLKGDEPPLPGHNPLGGWSVVAMLFLLIVQATSGTFAVDVDGIESGPLSYLVDFDQGRAAARIHTISFNILLGLVALHILAIAFYLIVHRRNLVGPMVTGLGHGHSPDAEPLRRGSILALLLSIVLAAAFTWWIVQGAPL